MTKPAETSPAQEFVRFDRLQRVEHIIFLISFSVLGFTGLPQKFILSPISAGIFSLVGGIENARLIHHASAFVMMIISMIHLLEALYRIFVLRSPIGMIPWINDIVHAYDDVLYYIGLRKHKAYYGRYSYAEKVEYLALIWGTIVMGLTGFMMWNPITTVRFFPGESIPAAKAAHGGEAVLAVLAIIIWHFYHVHIKHLNKSMFTGKLTREEMEHEHPAELAHIESGKHAAPIPPAVLRRRQMTYWPISTVLSVVMIGGIYIFLTIENTAPITTVPPAIENVQVYVPQTPTPMPTSTPTTEPQPGGVTGPLTWNDTIGPLLQAKCGACHGAGSVTGLAFDTYANFMKGGKNGAVALPNDSAGSSFFKTQASGHPVVFSADELAIIKAWIDAGAPEK